MNSELASVVWGLLSAASWGAGDFSGGLVSKRSNVYGVVIYAQIISLVCLFALAIVTKEVLPNIGQLLVSAIAGMGGCIGLLALYRALSLGRMGIAAPVAAVVTAAIPVLWVILTQGLPDSRKLIGFGLAFIAVWLVSASATGGFKPRDLILPIIAGTGFGVFLIALRSTGTDAVLYPLVAARVASITMLLIFVTVTRQSWRPDPQRVPLIAASGILDTGGNAFYLLSAVAGRLDVSAVLSSLYPATTVLLAWVILKERLSPLQILGVLIALVAIGLIAA